MIFGCIKVETTKDTDRVTTRKLDTWGFGFVRDDATNKVRLSGTEGGHQLV